MKVIRMLFKGLKKVFYLEAGFDRVTPNTCLLISSWAFEKAATISTIDIIDNRAVDINCYHPGYTLVEKLQTIATKFRQEQDDGIERPNYLRQYYDVYCLLGNEIVQKFIGTPEYEEHKKQRFPLADLAIPIAENEAFLLTDLELRNSFKKRYQRTANLYYKGQPDFETLLNTLKMNINKL